MAVSPQASEHATHSRSSVGFTRSRTTETKPSFKTTEFVAYIAAVAGVLIAAAIVGDGENAQDPFGARSAWLYITILSVGYMVSRGLAKAGSRAPSGDRSAA